ncbi:MAG: DUF2442 domain-containing protein [bacterium]
MEKLFEISDVALKGHVLSFKANGTSITCDLAKVSDVLAKASKEQVANMIVDQVGVGFHWPALDEDLSVNGILRELGVELPTSELEIEAHAELV